MIQRFSAVTLRQSAKKSSARKSAAPRFDLEMASPDLFSKMSHTPLREKGNSLVNDFSTAKTPFR